VVSLASFSESGDAGTSFGLINTAKGQAKTQAYHQYAYRFKNMN
jgi:hypothetical protein